MLKLKLKGPLQSWGTEKYGDYFYTDIKPTRSGIIGLIACVMGIKRDDPRIQELDNALKIYCDPDLYPNDGIMTDYHVISASEKRPMYLANGKNTEESAKQGMITRRNYIQNGEFDVIIDTINDDKSVLDEITAAFHDPYWIPYLGRKSCSVSEPIIPEYTETLPETFKELKGTPYVFNQIYSK